jgi:hypothetical protein
VLTGYRRSAEVVQSTFDGKGQVSTEAYHKPDEITNETRPRPIARVDVSSDLRGVVEVGSKPSGEYSALSSSSNWQHCHVTPPHLHPDSRKSPSMAGHSENTPKSAVSQTKGWWLFFPVKRIAVLLAITVSIFAIWYADESEDTFVAHSIMSEVYMPDKFGYGMVAKRNISVWCLLQTLHDFNPVPCSAGL